MSSLRQRPDRSLVVILLAGWLGSNTPSLAQAAPPDERFAAVVEESRHFLLGPSRHAANPNLLESYVSLAAETRSRPARFDISPLLLRATGFLRRHGIPLRDQLDPNSNEAIGVSASFAVRRDLPAVRFRAGGPTTESFGAFYSENGFRGSLAFPLERWSLRLEAGEDSELGYFGIIGAQWTHPRRPLALGFGLPMNLRTAGGGIGVVMQLRLKLD